MFGRIGGPPQYCGTSRAGLILLTELKKRTWAVVLQGSGAAWSLEMHDLVGGELKKAAGPVPANSPELAIALTAAEFIGLSLTAEEISD